MTRKLTILILALFALISGPGWGQKASGAYTLVTDASTLSSGDVIVLGCAGKGTAAGAMGTGAFLTSVDATISNGTLTSANAIEITLGGSAGAWTLTTSEGQITTSEAKKLVLNNGTQKTWTISITSAGVATITGGSYGSIQYNASSPRFVNYTSAQTAIEIYKKQSTPSATLESIEVSGTPTKTEYETGEEFDPAGLVVTGTYDDESTADLTNAADWTFDPATFTSTSQTSVSVTATVGDITSPAYTVNGLTVTEHVQTYANTYTSNVELTTEGGTSASEAIVIWESTEYNAIKCGTGKVDGACVVTIPANTQTLHFHAAGWNGETVKLNGTFDLVADGGVSGNSPFTLQNDPETSDYFTLNPQGATSITFTATTGKRFVLFGVNAEEGPVATLESISIKTVPDKVNYLEGENFDPTGLVITKHFVEEGADDEDLAYSETTASQFSFSPTLTAALAATDTQVEITVGGKSVNQAITVTEAPKYTVSYHTNGDVSSEQVYAGEIQLTAPANVPNGYTYVGWAIAPIEGVAQTATYFSSYDVTENVDLYAVFAMVKTSGENALVKMSAGNTLNDGDKIVIVATIEVEEENEVEKFALYQETTNTSYVSKYTFDTNIETILADDKNWLTVKTVEGGFTLGDATNGYIYNNENSLYCGEATATWTLLDLGDGTFKFQTDERNLSYRSDLTNNYWRMGGANYGTSGQTKLDVYKVLTSSSTCSNFCTTVTALSGNLAEATTVAGNAYYISAAANVPANETATINGVLGNADASLLIIEDGAQLFQNSSNVMATFQKNITGYTGDNDNYYLIANPTANAVGEEDEYDALDGCTTFDLYTFDPTAELEWVNIGQTAQKVTFDRNVGYLYANAQDMTLHFRGYLLPTNGTTDINLVYYTGGEAGREFPGFNLIGNPYTCNAYVNGYNFYTMADGEFVINEGSATVAPCEGFFVEATEANQSVTVSTAAPVTAPNALSLNVSQNRGNVIDRAIVRFDGANDLHKFMMNPAHTNLSIAKGGETFAAISTEAEGELPVNFKAEKNGTYTITVNTKNVDAEYLHLIDNMTGMDVDLLSTPSYTFEAKTSDYASRFKLVFGVNNTASESSDSNFAFMSDGNLVINNIEGEATLQIVDELGRVISTETVSGSYNKALNLKAGLYIINLNGMTQKIVVK